MSVKRVVCGKYGPKNCSESILMLCPLLIYSGFCSFLRSLWGWGMSVPCGARTEFIFSSWLFLKAEFPLTELHSFCPLPSSSSEASFSFPSHYGFLVNMLYCNRTSQWKSKLPLYQSVNISWNNMLSFEILSKEHLKTYLPLSMSHWIRASFPFLLFKPLPGNLVKAIRI